MRTEDLIAELEAVMAASESPDGYMTLKEIASEWHETVLPNSSEIRRTRDALVALKSQGRIDCVTVKREALDGRRAAVPAYRVLSA